MSIKQVVTCLFTDIEHSTRLAQQLRERYPDVLEQHRSVVREAISKYQGTEAGVAGDGFFIIFEAAWQAVAAASEIQKAHITQQWARNIGLKVRMGVHTGVALCSDDGCTGVEVHFASRVCDAAHGGQVLLSHVTQQLIQKDLDSQFTTIDLGSYLIKDFDDPVRLYQLNIPGAVHQFPKPRIDQVDKRVAILPFTNLSTDPEQDYFCDGMAEEIIIALGKIQGLRVVSRASSFAIKGENLDVRRKAQKLNATSIVEGRVRMYNGHIKISVELIDADSGLNLWSASYNSPRDQIFHMQDEITRSIVEALECSLIPECSIAQYRQTDNVQAYDYYLRGHRFYMQFSNHGMDLALQMLAKAIEADNTYALAFAGIADCYSYQFQHLTPSTSILEKADVASKRAIELAPGLADVHASRGIVLTLQGNFAEAEKSFQCAIECDPTLYLGWFHYGRMCFTIGKLEKAARMFEQAHRVEPDDYQSVLLAAQVHADLGSTTLAIRLRKRGVENAGQRLALNPGDTRALYFAANALALLNEHEKSIRYLSRALALDPNDSMVLYNVGCVYALLGMEQEALTCLERSHEQGLTLRGWYENDSNLDSVRDHPRFSALMAKMPVN